jgi:hypothetical protein
MDHNLKLSPDMDQTITAHRERWIRSHALKAAVAFHQVETMAEDVSPSMGEVLNTSMVFEEYIRDGKVPGNA